MRVLFLTGEFPPMQGGVGDCTNEIARALAKRGVQVAVLTTDDGQQTEQNSTLSPQSSGLSPQPLVHSPQPSALTIFRTIKNWDWSALAQIRRAIAETQADIVHIQYQTGAFGMHPMINFAPHLLFPPSLFRGGGRRVRCVVTFHDLRPMYLFPKAGRLRDWVTFQLARTSDAVIATNKEDYAALATHHLKDLDLIPIGSNIEPTPLSDLPREQLRATLGVRPDEILLCYFGFLNESKGGETLLSALAEIPDAKLLMLGGQTGASDPTNVAYLAHVKRTLDNLGLTARVIWTDYLPQTQISAHFFASDICVLPYRDGVSYRRGTFMAALAHGKAIITTKMKEEGGRMKDDGGRMNPPSSVLIPPSSSLSPHPSVLRSPSSVLPTLRDGENVLLIPPDDPQAIANAVRRIASSPELRAQLEQGARATAQFFAWDTIADAHLALYQKLFANHNSLL